MIELAVGPEDRIVTTFARCGEAQLNVVQWRSRCVVILQVTRSTGGGAQIIVVVDVAIETDTRRVGVRIGQREANRVVVKRCRLPSARGVAHLAIL